MLSKSSRAPGPIFATTRWSVVLAAVGNTSPEAAAALETICQAYWYPLYVYARRSGMPVHDAQDITQEFFRGLLEKRWLASAERERGRLRTFLIVALKNFMAKEWRRAGAQRRGGGAAHVPVDAQFAEIRFAADSRLAAAPVEDAYDRQWALTLLERTLGRLQREFANVGRARDFEALKGCLMAARGAIDYSRMAIQLEVNENAARVAVHRLRRRFRETFREEIAQTLGPGEEIEAEMQHLAAALARE